MVTSTIESLQIHGQRTAHTLPRVVSAEALAQVPYGYVFARQGDLYFIRLAHVPAGVMPWPYLHGQLAPGTTQGARHTVDLGQVTLWLLREPGPFDGPIIEAPHGVAIVHPEHAVHIYPPVVCQVRYQQVYVGAPQPEAD